MLGQPLLTKSNILIAILLVVLGITCFLYYQSTTTRIVPNTSSKHVLTHSSSDEAIQNSTSLSDKDSETPNKIPPRTKPSIAVTPEEKRIVAEKKVLNGVLEAGDKHLQTLNLQEQALHDKDQQAQRAIEALEEKLQGLSK